MGSHHPIRKTVAPEPIVVPDKLYFRIGDVAKLCDVPAYVLRFWETEFPQLKPNKGGTGQRLYRKRDVETALRIKSLLYDQGYTIPGARLVFKTDTKTDALRPEAAPEPTLTPEISAPIDLGAQIRQDAQQRNHLLALRSDLQSLAAQLNAPVGAHQLPPTLKPASEAKPMRPRLVLETAHTPSKLSSDPKPAIHLNQGDLFAAE